MNDFEALKIVDFDHLEFAVDNLDEATQLYTKLGFRVEGEREILERKLRSRLLIQNQVQILLSHSADASDAVAKYVSNHGWGVIGVAFRCEDATSALEIVTGRGAEALSSPKTTTRDFGVVTQSSIKAFGDVRHTFVSREGNLFLEGFDTEITERPFGQGLKRFDHITNNVEMGKLDVWAEWYEKIFGLRVSRFFDIHTDNTGLLSKVMESPNGLIKMPINEPTEAASQIQEFLDIHHGPGVQHVALLSTDIISTLTEFRKVDIDFLSVPDTYYDAISDRVPNITENMESLKKLGILVDGDQKGYLLQIFTKPVVGPFFYEVIQRKGNQGFGEGNFKALFEAIERDQRQRGVV